MSGAVEAFLYGLVSEIPIVSEVPPFTLLGRNDREEVLANSVLVKKETIIFTRTLYSRRFLTFLDCSSEVSMLKVH